MAQQSLPLNERTVAHLSALHLAAQQAQREFNIALNAVLAHSDVQPAPDTRVHLDLDQSRLVYEVVEPPAEGDHAPTELGRRKARS